ncbi:MAG: hypothetical protein WCP99_05150 [Burkholderiales bacterium]
MPATAADANKCLIDAFGARTRAFDATGNVVAGFKTYLLSNDLIKISKAENFVYAIQRTHAQVDSDSEKAIKLNKFPPHVVQVFDGVTIGWGLFKDVLTPYARQQVQELIGK